MRSAGCASPGRTNGDPYWCWDATKLYLLGARGDRQREAHGSWNLGAEYEKLGDLEQAVEFMQVLVDFEREIGHPDAEKHADLVEEIRARLTAGS